MWHKKIKDDLSEVDNCVSYFMKELEEAKKEVNQSGLMVNVLDKLPSFYEYRYGQFQEIEAVLEVLDSKIEGKKTERYKKFLEHYQRALSSTDVKRYVDGDPDVLELVSLRIDINYIRNRYYGIISSFEKKHYALSNITKLRVAGIEDASI